jgi:hypothetical protein
MATLRPVRMEIVQPSSESAESAQLGMLRDTESGEQWKAIPVAVVGIIEHRVFFGDQEFGKEPLCKSYDGIIPELNIHKPQSTSCKSCPQSVWVNGKRSACKQKAIVQFVHMENATPYDLIAPGTSFGACMELRAKLDRDILRKSILQGLNMNYHDYRMTMTTQWEKKGTHRYLVLKFTDLKATKEPNPVLARLFQSQLTGGEANVRTDVSAVPTAQGTKHDLLDQQRGDGKPEKGIRNRVGGKRQRTRPSPTRKAKARRRTADRGRSAQEERIPTC